MIPIIFEDKIRFSTKEEEEQFDVEEDPEIVELHDRIDAIILFEKLL